VFPSLYEGYGMPNMEAMASGCPVITTNAFAISEIVGDSAVIIDDPHNYKAIAAAIIDVLADKEKSKLMRAYGRQRARCFSWEKSAGKVINVYRELIDERQKYV
jgi:glycosyltransferase involved in cell wall biosynthesis